MEPKEKRQTYYEKMRIISRVEKRRWMAQHHNGAVTFHRTLKEAKAYVLWV
jgi:hypothetical protein